MKVAPISAVPLALAALLLSAPLLSAPLGAETIRQNDRYTLVVVDDGYIRLDTQTGEIARCTGDPNKLTCRLAADERLAYADEIDRLEDRIIRLEARVARLETVDGAPGASDRSRSYGLPSDEELDQVMNMTDKVFRRFFGLVKDLKRDLETDRL